MRTPNTIESIKARLVAGPNGCLVWPGGLASGYGNVGYQGKYGGVHRILYEARFGPVPEGFELDHLCRNRACSNLDHLEVVTRRENVLRGIRPAAFCAKQTHCKRGHPFDEANTYFYKSDGRRGCRICKRASNRLYKIRKKSR